MTTGYLIYKEKDIKRNLRFINMLISTSKANNIILKLISHENIFFSIKNNSLEFMYPLPSFVINRSRDYEISEYFEILKIKVFNNSNITRIFNNKALSYAHISKLNINIMDSDFINENSFSRNNISFQNRVLKENTSFGGNDVFLIKNKNDILENLKPNKNYCIQNLNDNNGIDIRTFILDNNIVSSIKRENSSNFKANIAKGATASVYTLNDYEKNIINKILSCFKFDYVGIDFLISKDGKFIFNEIEDAVGAKSLYECTNIDIASLFISHIVKWIKNI